MLKSTLTAMTIVGCDCDARLCEFISETPPTWQSVAECEAAARERITTGGALNYPLVTGICRDAPEAAVEASIATADVPVLDASGDARSAAVPAGLGDRVYDTVSNGGAIAYRLTSSGYVAVRSGFDEGAHRAMDFLRRSASTILPASFAGR